MSRAPVPFPGSGAPSGERPRVGAHRWVGSSAGCVLARESGCSDLMGLVDPGACWGSLGDGISSGSSGRRDSGRRVSEDGGCETKELSLMRGPKAADGGRRNLC